MKWITESYSLGNIKHCVLALHFVNQSSLEGMVHSQEKSRLTLINVPGETGQNTTQRCCIKKLHGAEEDPTEQLVVEHGGSLHRALSTQTTAVFEHDT